MARTEPRTAPMPALQQRRHRRCAAHGVQLCRACRTANAAPTAFLTATTYAHSLSKAPSAERPLSMSASMPATAAAELNCTWLGWPAN